MKTVRAAAPIILGLALSGSLSGPGPLDQNSLKKRISEQTVYLHCLRSRLAGLPDEGEADPRARETAVFLKDRVAWVVRKRARILDRLDGPTELPHDPGLPFGELGVFYDALLDQELRLSAVFPIRSNEISRIAPDEILGDEIGDNVIALTIDDGPSTRYSARLLDILRSREVPATFFLLGNRISADDDKTLALLSRMRREGHGIGLHGWDHKPLDGASGIADLAGRLDGPKDVIRSITGHEVDLFRAPYGRRAIGLIDYLGQSGMRHVLWNIDSLDWRRELPDADVTERVVHLARLHDGGIILFHDFVPRTQRVLPIVIDRLLAEGFVLRKLSEILEGGPGH